MKYTLLSIVLGLSLAFMLGVNVHSVNAIYLNINSVHSKDTTIADLTGFTDKNWGSHKTTAYFGLANGTFNSNILIWFDLTPVMGNEINSANLSLYSTGEAAACGGEGNYSLIADVYALKSTWEEGTGTGDIGAVGTASWDARTDIFTWFSGTFSDGDYWGDKVGTAVIDCGTAKRFYWEISPGWINNFTLDGLPYYGFVMAAGNYTNNPIYFIMRENGTGALIPYLELDYESVPPTPLPYNFTAERSTCLDDKTLYSKVYAYSDNGTAVLNDQFKYCDYGCLNSTITGLGAAGCAENPLQSALLFMVALVGVIAVLAWLNKR